MGNNVVLNIISKMIVNHLESIDSVDKKIEAINHLKLLIHQHSPFHDEPVDCVLWVKAETIKANDYNPNVMAMVEKKLLLRSIEMDGFTQPIVVSNVENHHVVVDGFHRQVIGTSNKELRKRLAGYLPVTFIKNSRKGEKERIAATIRHNRARGKHQIAAMSDIVRDLYRLGWDDKKIGMELGMDEDEVLRLKQISGLSELFVDQDYSDAWTIE